MTELTSEQRGRAWEILALCLEQLDVRDSDGKPFLEKVPGFHEFASSEAGRQWIRLRTARLMDFSHPERWVESANAVRQLIGLPGLLPPIVVYGGEVGTEYPRLTSSPTPKELKNLWDRGGK